MLFNTIRIVLWLIMSVCVLLIIKKLKISLKKSGSVLVVVLCMVMVSISGIFPPENLFINYKSPESVFNYTNSGKIDDVVYGQDSCMVVYSNASNTAGQYIIPKTIKGYKIPNYFAIKKVSHKFDKDGIFDIYNVKGTKDYYIFGTVHLNENDNKINVFNEKSEKIDAHIVRVENTSFIYFYLHDFSSEYYLLINDEKVFLQ